MKRALVAPLLVASALGACYWDSDCSATSPQCCIGGVCQSESSCSVLRSYPRPNFQQCAISGDCRSGCCMEGFCTWADSCDDTANKTPLVIFLILLVIASATLIWLLAREVLRNKLRRQLDNESQGNARLLSQRYQEQTSVPAVVPEEEVKEEPSTA